MLYRICQTLLHVIYATIFRLKASGMENIPSSGPVLLCSNHISVLDPTTVGVKVRRRVHYMAKEELFKFKPIGAFLRAIGAFPVKRGGVGKESIRTALSILKDGKVMGIFPEGTRSEADRGMGKKGAALFAIRSGAVVIPVAIVGPYKAFGRLTVRYGEPVDLSDLSGDGAGSDALDLATDRIMKGIRDTARGA